MQLGARWTVGAPPHRSVPPVLLEAIAEIEAEPHGLASSWTLTWLEGRPRLVLDGELRLTLDGSGDPVHVARGADGAHTDPISKDDEDEDDWLN